MISSRTRAGAGLVMLAMLGLACSSGAGRTRNAASLPPSGHTARSTVPGSAALPGSVPSGSSPSASASPRPGPTSSSGAGGTTPTSVVVLPGAPPNPGPVSPTPDGTYAYSDHVHPSSGHDDSGTLTMKVRPAASHPGALGQSIVLSGPGTGSGQGNGSEQELVSWQPAAQLLESQTFSFGNQSATCSWSTPVSQLRFPLAKGKHWALASSCEVTVFGQVITLRLSGSVAVSGTARVQVGAVPADVWVLDSILDIRGTGTFTFTLHQSAHHELAPRQGIEVIEQSTTSFSSPQGSDTFNEDRELQSLTPSGT